MQYQSHGKFKFIGHIVDHFSKFHILFPLETKSAGEVARNCVEKFFSIFGLPLIIHSDNGSEFVNDVIRATAVLWPGKSNFVNGSVGHSQSQGLVEQGNNTIRIMIAARLEQEKKCEWANWLPEFQCKNLSYILKYKFFL